MTSEIFDIPQLQDTASSLNGNDCPHPFTQLETQTEGDDAKYLKRVDTQKSIGSVRSLMKTVKNLKDTINDINILRGLLAGIANTNDFISNLEGEIGEQISMNESLFSSRHQKNSLLLRKSCCTKESIERNEKQNFDKEFDYSNREIIIDLPADGGKDAWMTLFASFLLNVATWGANSSSGVILQYYLNNNVFQGATQYDYAIITCIVIALAQLLAPIALLLIPIIGFKKTLILGCFLNFSGYLLASFATKKWQLYCTEGLIVGISFSLLFIPGSAVIPQWFLKKRALASGVCVSGAGFGGIIFSLTVNKFIEITGSQRWALRYLCLSTTFLTLIAILLIKSRIYKREKITKAYVSDQLSILFDLSIFKEFSPCCIGVWFCFAFLAYVMELYTLSDYATSVGLTAKQGATITTLFNLGQFIGRPLLGLVADSFGRINLTVFVCIFNMITFFAWWINAVSYGSLLSYGFVSGITMGIGSLMVQPLTADSISKPSKFPAAYSLVNIFVGLIAFVCEVIPLALREPDSKMPYLHSQIYGGCCILMSILIICIFREWKLRKLLNKRYTEILGILKDQQASTSNNKDKENDIDNQCDISVKALETEKLSYEKLLKPEIRSFFLRMFYHIKV